MAIFIYYKFIKTQQETISTAGQDSLLPKVEQFLFLCNGTTSMSLGLCAVPRKG